MSTSGDTIIPTHTVDLGSGRPASPAAAMARREDRPRRTSPGRRSTSRFPVHDRRLRDRRHRRLHRARRPRAARHRSGRQAAGASMSPARSSAAGARYPFRYRDCGNLATIGRHRGGHRFWPAPPVRPARLGAVVHGAHLLPRRLSQPPVVGRELAVELPHLSNAALGSSPATPRLHPRRLKWLNPS